MARDDEAALYIIYLRTLGRGQTALGACFAVQLYTPLPKREILRHMIYMR